MCVLREYSIYSEGIFFWFLHAYPSFSFIFLEGIFLIFPHFLGRNILSFLLFSLKEYLSFSWQEYLSFSLIFPKGITLIFPHFLGRNIPHFRSFSRQEYLSFSLIFSAGISVIFSAEVSLIFSAGISLVFSAGISLIFLHFPCRNISLIPSD